MRGRRRWSVIPAALAAAALLVAQAIAPPRTEAVGPSIAITDPAPGLTVLVGARFQLGWSESAPPSAPIVGREIVEYAGSLARSGNCSETRYSTAWTTTSANPPLRFPISGFGAWRCYYWVVTLTDVNGLAAVARSGYVLGMPAADPSVGMISPMPGALTGATPASYTLRWTETASAGVAKRIVTEQSAPMAGGPSCTEVTWWTARTFRPTASSLALSDLVSGRCYRYTVAVWDAHGRWASAVGGPFLVTSAPPPCTYGDVLTTYSDYSDWSRTLIDTIYRLPSTYVPGDLVSTTRIDHLSGAFQIRSIAYADLKALADAARAAGAPIDLTSTFRSYASQQATYDFYVNAFGATEGLLRAARPGHSEHQLGTAIDVKAYNGVSPSNYTDWTVTQAGAWMRDNAWRYGWLMSYPQAASPSITCYQYEPWHYRYVGRSIAEAVHDAGLTLREYLWRHGSIAPGAWEPTGRPGR